MFYARITLRSPSLPIHRKRTDYFELPFQRCLIYQILQNVCLGERWPKETPHDKLWWQWSQKKKAKYVQYTDVIFLICPDHFCYFVINVSAISFCSSAIKLFMFLYLSDCFCPRLILFNNIHLFYHINLLDNDDSAQPIVPVPSCRQPRMSSTRKRKIKALGSKLDRLRRKLNPPTNIRKSNIRDMVHRRKVQQAITAVTPCFSGPALRLVQTQLKMSSRKTKGFRWNTKDKGIALTLLHSCPKAYSILSKIFSLPSVKTLKRCMANIKICPGFNEIMIEAFKIKVNSMSDKDKLCSVVMDEISIKESLVYNPEVDEVWKGLKTWVCWARPGTRPTMPLSSWWEVYWPNGSSRYDMCYLVEQYLQQL